MKNGLLIWNAVLTVVAGFLLYSHLTAGRPSLPPVQHSKVDSAAIQHPFRIAYIEMDSIENNYLMVKDVRDEINKRERQYNNDLAKLDVILNNKAEGYRKRAGAMSQDDLEKARVDMRETEDQLKGRKMELDEEYQKYVMHSQFALKQNISEFLKRYERSKEFSYIIVYDQNLFYYRDTAYNITTEVLKGLNEEYRAAKH